MHAFKNRKFECELTLKYRLIFFRQKYNKWQFLRFKLKANQSFEKKVT